MNEPPTDQLNTSLSTSATTIDEDWSIISSSSDIDDDNTNHTTNNHNNNATLTKHNKTNPINKKENKSSSSLFTPTSSSSSINKSTKSSSSVIDDNLSQSINVGGKIKFFENLSYFNESIKQKSNHFYSNFAKIKIDQLNQFINDQNEINKSTSSINENLDETIELTSQDAAEPDEQRPKKPVMKKILSEQIDFVQQLLSDNSDYLYYYLFTIVLGLIPIIYCVHYLFTPKEIVTKPMTSFDKLNMFWNDLIFEKEEAKKSFFSFGSNVKVKKVNKLAKYSDHLKDKYYPKVDRLAKNFLDWEKMKLFTTQGCDRIDEFGKVSRREIERLSIFGYNELKQHGGDLFHNIKHYSEKGGLKVEDYTSIGYKGFKYYGSSFINGIEKFSKMSGSKIEDYSVLGYQGFKTYGSQLLNSVNKYKNISSSKIENYSALGYQCFKTYGTQLLHDVNKYSKIGGSKIEMFSTTTYHELQHLLNRLNQNQHLPKTSHKLITKWYNNVMKGATNLIKPSPSQSILSQIKTNLDTQAITVYETVNCLFLCPSDIDITSSTI